MEWVLVLSVLLANGGHYRTDIPLPGGVCYALVSAFPVREVRTPVVVLRAECRREQP